MSTDDDELGSFEGGGDAQILADLPRHLRSRCCPLTPVDDSHESFDHGHTDCYFMALAAQTIEYLREVNKS